MWRGGLESKKKPRGDVRWREPRQATPRRVSSATKKNMSRQPTDKHRVFKLRKYVRRVDALYKDLGPAILPFDVELQKISTKLATFLVNKPIDQVKEELTAATHDKSTERRLDCSSEKRTQVRKDLRKIIDTLETLDKLLVQPAAPDPVGNLKK